MIAAGFARLDVASLGEDEDTITQRLRQAMDRFVNDARSPEWCNFFHVREEARIDDSGKTGKSRERVDIEIECSTARPRPVFSFEAKPLRDSHSVANYVGPDGLGCLCRGMYASDFDFGGMLGYVCKPMREEWIEKIQRKLDKERATHGLAPTGPVWTVAHLAEGLGESRCSVHERKGLAAIEVYHSFVLCYAVSDL